MKSKVLDSLSLFIGKIFDAGIMFIFNILAARLVGIENYGIYVFISSTVMLVSIFIKMGLDQGITVLVPRGETLEEKSIIVTTGLVTMYAVVAVILVVIMLLSNRLAGTVLNDPTYSRYLTYYAPILLILPFTQLAEGIFRSIYKIQYYVIGKSIIMPIGIMGSFLVFYYGFQVEGLIALFLCNYVGFGLGAIFMLWHMIRQKLLFTSSPFHISTFTPLISISLPLIFLGLHEYLIGRTDAFVIGYFMDEANVGVFNIADKVAYISSFILVAAGSIVAPEISRHYHNKEFGHLGQVYHESTKLLVMVNTMVFFGLAIIARLFMDFTTGGGYDGWIVLIFLSLAYLIHSMFGPVAYMNSMTGNQKEEFRIATVMIISNVALDVILLRYIGIKGIALSTIIVFLIGDIYRANQMHQQMGILPSIKNVYIAVIGLAAFVVIRLGLSQLLVYNELLTIAIEVVVFGILYVSAIYLLMVTKDEKRFLVKQYMKMTNNNNN